MENTEGQLPEAFEKACEKWEQSELRYRTLVMAVTRAIAAGMSTEAMRIIGAAIDDIQKIKGSVCTCTKFRETPMINGKHICSICNKPIVQTDI